MLTIDGSRCIDLDGFAAEISRHLVDHTWYGNLDALNDILRGGFGTPEGGFVLRWLDSSASRRALGHRATAARLEEMLSTCHPVNRDDVGERLAAARRGVGPTLFDELVEIIRCHGPGGPEAGDGVELDLR